MSATTVSQRQVGVKSRSKSTVKRSPRYWDRVFGAVVQGIWVFGLVFVVTYFVASMTGHLMGESQRVSAKVLTPQLRKARAAESDLKTLSATVGSLQQVDDWARAQGWVKGNLKQVAPGTYVASR